MFHEIVPYNFTFGLNVKISGNIRLSVPYNIVMGLNNVMQVVEDSRVVVLLTERVTTSCLNMRWPAILCMNVMTSTRSAKYIRRVSIP